MMMLMMMVMMMVMMMMTIVMMMLLMMDDDNDGLLSNPYKSLQETVCRCLELLEGGSLGWRLQPRVWSVSRANEKLEGASLLRMPGLGCILLLPPETLLANPEIKVLEEGGCPDDFTINCR